MQRLAPKRQDNLKTTRGDGLTGRPERGVARIQDRRTSLQPGFQVKPVSKVPLS
jgi:hypothetical protein